jgi:putative membrane protein
MATEQRHPDDQLDDPRVRFAAERTFLAWIRTGLAMMGFGFIVARFGLLLQELAAARGMPLPRSPGVSIWVGSALIVLGVVVHLVTAVQYARLLAWLRKGVQIQPEPWPLAVIVAVLLAAIGTLMTVYLIGTSI